MAFVFAASAAFAAEAAGDDGSAHPYSELSENDMQALQDSYGSPGPGESIRYDFEQRVLPAYVLKEYAEALKEMILAQSDEAMGFPRMVWNLSVIRKIIDIQMNSKDTYVFPAWEEDDGVMDQYAALAKASGLESNDIFDVSFQSPGENSAMVLLTFHNTDTYLACKYIGIALKDDTLRYFTAETDTVFAPDTIFFCEVKPDRRGTIDTIGFAQEDFIGAVRETLNAATEGDENFVIMFEFGMEKEP
ncbi:MAG: hypothetical protein FWF69_09530 [Firmicutes bacterium]|nr:hypothetical protein [Bacillota bacterium]